MEKMEACSIAGLPTSAVTVAPPAVLTPAFGPKAIPDVARRILFVGRFTPAKNIEAILAAWPKISIEMPSAELLLAGDGLGSYAEGLKRKIVMLAETGAKVSMFGWATECERWRLYREADLLVVPSFYESFGRVIMEGGATGLPVLVSNRANIALSHNTFDFLRFCDVDPDTMASTICAALEDAVWRRRCANEAPQTVKRAFGPQAAASRFVEMYRLATKSPQTH